MKPQTETPCGVVPPQQADCPRSGRSEPKSESHYQLIVRMCGLAVSVQLGREVIDRCNLTVHFEPGMQACR